MQMRAGPLPAHALEEIPEPQPEASLGEEVFAIAPPPTTEFAAPDFDFQDVFGAVELPAATAPSGPSVPQQRVTEEADADSTLRDIYARETDSHVAVVRNYLDREAGQPSPHALPEAVYRACHTLAGSSKMADARHGIRLAQPLDHWLRKAFDSGIGLVDEDLALLGDCMLAMEGVSRNLDEATGFFLAHDLLRERIAQAETALDQRIVASQVAIEPPSVVVAPQAAVVPAAIAAPVPDYDTEIATIFSDEATELLEAAQAALAGTGPHSAHVEQLTALKRPLHTLKGGARMAGVTAMGDLAHELETLITRVEIGVVPWGPLSHVVVQASLDELARMRDLLADGRPVGPAAALMERVQTLGEAPVEPQGYPEAAQAAPVSPERVIEPVSAYGETPPAVVEFAEVFAEVHEPLGATLRAPGWPADRAFEGTAGPAAVALLAEAETALPFMAPPTELPVATAVASEPGPAVASTIAVALVPPGREPTVPGDRPELARVDAELLNQLLNSAGEVSIARSRVEQQLGSVDFNLGELSRTVTRLKEQLRKLEIETETQILHRHEGEAAHRGDFDPLELDRYSSIQQFSRALAETANDVASIQQLLETLTRETQNLLQQQGRTITELQNGLMRTRMVSFQRHVQRLSRIVRQAAADTQKQVGTDVEGAAGELDRQVLERMLPPLEHMLRNAVVHGIEPPAERLVAGQA